VQWECGLRFNKRNRYRWFERKWKPALVTDIGSFRKCNLGQRGTGYAILDLDRVERGWIQYNIETHKRLNAEGCVVVGRGYGECDAWQRNYYILFVTPTGLKNKYTRVRAGWILSDYVARQGVQGGTRVVSQTNRHIDTDDINTYITSTCAKLVNPSSNCKAYYADVFTLASALDVSAGLRVMARNTITALTICC
jgi:hypothetical protein